MMDLGKVPQDPRPLIRTPLPPPPFHLKNPSLTGLAFLGLLGMSETGSKLKIT